MRDQNKSFFLVALCVLAVCCQPVVRAGSSEQVSVTVGRKFTVALVSNPGTGYFWVLADSLKGWLDEVDKTYVAANPGLPGGSGTEYLTFQATGSGSTSLTFQHKRPWEGTPIKVHVCKVTATVSTDAQNIFVVPGENFTVALTSNPSADYSWTLAGSLPRWLEQVDKTEAVTNPGLSGGGGAEYWTFRPTATGNATLIFQYERPWEGMPIQTHICHITATSLYDTEKTSVAVGDEFLVEVR